MPASHNSLISVASRFTIVASILLPLDEFINASPLNFNKILLQIRLVMISLVKGWVVEVILAITSTQGTLFH
jgi:hypothetical protein